MAKSGRPTKEREILRKLHLSEEGYWGSLRDAIDEFERLCFNGNLIDNPRLIRHQFDILTEKAVSGKTLSREIQSILEENGR